MFTSCSFQRTAGCLQASSWQHNSEFKAKTFVTLNKCFQCLNPNQTSSQRNVKFQYFSAMTTSATLVLKPESTCLVPLPVCCISAHLDEWSLPDGGLGR